MSKQKMIADSKFFHDGVLLRPNDPFECSEDDAKDLIAIGFAHVAPNAVDAVVEAVTQTVKRTYRRRDMTAQ